MSLCCWQWWIWKRNGESKLVCYVTVPITPSWNPKIFIMKCQMMYVKQKMWNYQEVVGIQQLPKDKAVSVVAFHPGWNKQHNFPMLFLQFFNTQIMKYHIWLVFLKIQLLYMTFRILGKILLEKMHIFFMLCILAKIVRC